ncbi:MAG: hypothetical protein L0K86_00690 [Actinomycetia bacterium]|nr:hypothetical protein [Actinomycetes bacterium]
MTRSHPSLSGAFAEDPHDLSPGSETPGSSALVGSAAVPAQRFGMLITVEQVALLWFGEIGENGSASSNCQKIRRLIPDLLPARRIGNRWYVNRAVAEEWARGSDPASVMAHPDTRAAMAARAGARS